MPSLADNNLEKVLFPLPGGPLIVIINYIPPMFNAFLVIWLTGIEHRKYQNNQYWKGPRSVSVNNCRPQNGNTMVASGCRLISR
jgi:hypothetical protein